MDLIAGEAREILLAISVDDWAGLRDRSRFPAYISLGGGLDLTWLDLLALAARETTGLETPGPFTLASHSLDSRLAGTSERTVERADPRSIGFSSGSISRPVGVSSSVQRAAILSASPTGSRAIASTQCELTGDLLDFCRRAEGAEDVIFAWSL